ncbi:MAG: glycogen/starch synthase [Candidatus Krumholzibacteria bacterium]|nr:glycogen/starch synthase [Candidatus Krumholzibacteria bacterium]
MTSDRITAAIVTTEIVPFSKVGGLADVMGALPDELEKLGCDITVFTPLYASIDRKKFGIRREKAGAGGLSAKVGGREVPFGLARATKPGTGITVWFVENEHFYGRPGIYTTEEGEGFADEDERTVFFNRAVIAAMRRLGMRPDVIHCNDFHAGLIPVYLAVEDDPDVAFQGAGTVFSVHNLAYQGLFEPDFLPLAGLDPRLFKPMSPFEFWGRVNVMKMALMFSGLVSTVSRSYAEEITTSDEYGYGLEGVLRYRRDDLVGILNGIDTKEWDPATDQLLPARFSADDQAGKHENKRELLKAFGLSPGKEPVIGIVSRLVDQKGFDILSEAFPRLMELGVKFAILGTGQQKYHELYTEMASEHPERFGVRLEFNNRLAHLVEAGSDFFLMPSRYEPCGLNQMYSLRYGTVPIVRATGGLRDTITDLDTGSGGNGFTFEEYTPSALLDAVRRAVKFFGDSKRVREVRARIMREDHSWENSAREYVALYERARGRVGMRLTTP